MTSEERKSLIAELRKYHEALLPANAYFAAKVPHYPDVLPEVKCVGLYPTEVAKGDYVYIECVTIDYKPLDNSRRLYVWGYREDYATIYKLSEKTGQYLIPCSYLTQFYLTCTLPIEGEVYKDEAFIVENTLEEKFVEITYKGKGGNRHKLKTKNGTPSEYSFTADTSGRSFVLCGENLEEIVLFFKQLKL